MKESCVSSKDKVLAVAFLILTVLNKITRLVVACLQPRWYWSEA